MERASKVTTWSGVAASAVALLAFFGIENYEELRQAVTEQAADSKLEAYQAVNAGDCLRNWATGQNTWAAEVPQVIACGADGAALWVSHVADATSGCPSDGGRYHLSYTSDEGETVALCITRQFEVGQCLLGSQDGSVNLWSWVDCRAGVPAPYNQVYSITGVYAAPAHPTSDDCDRTPSDGSRYTYWLVDDETVLLCAVAYSD
ncbi:LppU/SCO3897 family protein [Streptomyces johnsoniae]|uniref:Secreted protein n=1 Tax=Streptomyces johnsoniae TaxID=3075532 RepID=A0ABU2RX91_9ACTN|nr:hypothetical protein [Streptomyces sp. DSM 41886]MDT0441366.1 hypothetical protein [Streptomyces sp. DSM 41886]